MQSTLGTRTLYNVICIQFRMLMRQLKERIYKFHRDNNMPQPSIYIIFLIIQKMSYKKTTSSLPSTNLQASKKPDPIINQLFSTDFLGHLKDQLNKKAILSKTNTKIEENLITLKSKYENQIRELLCKVKKLQMQNQHLRKTLDLTTPNKQTVQNRDGKQEDTSSNNIKKLMLVSLDSIKMCSNDTIIANQQRQMLREKVRNLEDYKMMKQKRFHELIAKGAFHLEEINLLKLKNQELESALKQIRATMMGFKFVESIQLKPNTTSFKKSDNLFCNNTQKTYFVPQQTQNILKPNHYDSHVRHQSGQLLISHTVQLVIPPEYNIHNKEWMVSNNMQTSFQFNEIDYVIGEEIPYLKFTKANQSKTTLVNVNESLVMVKI